MATDRLRSDLLAELIRRQLPCGGWASLTPRSQPAIEPTCYSILALGGQATDVFERAQEFLLRVQNPNGSWPVFPGDDQDGSWGTSLAAITLRDSVPAIPARLRGFDWLLNCAGKEANWFWKWKFRTADRHVRFDPDKFGWPWEPGAIDARRNSCLGGGWNAGNAVVYGAALAPHADDTAIALLALRDQAKDPVVQSSVDYLEEVAPTLSAPWSLAWAILALAAHRRPIELLLSSLAAFPDLPSIEDTSTLALPCLALDHRRTLSAFGVTP